MTTSYKQKHDRITISLPYGYSTAIKRLATELSVSQSDLIAKAFDAFMKLRKKERIKEIALLMVDEYRQNTDLIALTSLDSEGFK